MEKLFNHILDLRNSAAPPQDRKVLWVLGAGFTLTITLLLGSGWLSIQAIQTVEVRSEALLAEHRISTQLIDEIQGEEAGLSDLFYALLASPDPAQRANVLGRLGQIEQDVSRTLSSVRNETDAELWSEAQVAVEDFMSEVRRRVDPGVSPPVLAGRIAAQDLDVESEPDLAALYASHRRLVRAISDLVTANYQTAIDQESLEAANHRQRLGQAVVLLGIALLLAIVCALVTVRTAGRMYMQTAWQAKELSRLSAHVMETQEKMLQRFSRELHDEFGQALTAIEANLAAVPVTSEEAASRIEDCTLLVKDLMSNVRELSQLLRPSTLDDFGLQSGLHWLAESFEQRTGIKVELRINFSARLSRDVETHLYRIAQEALTNVARHSKASLVTLLLEERLISGRRPGVRLAISDNGGGLRTSSERTGLGLAGMRERMRLCGGKLEIQSSNEGLTIVAEVAQDENTRWFQTDPSPVSG